MQQLSVHRWKRRDKIRVYKYYRRALNGFTLPHPKTWSFVMLLYAAETFLLIRQRLVGTAAISNELFPRLHLFCLSTRCTFPFPAYTLFAFFCPFHITIRWKLSVHDKETEAPLEYPFKVIQPVVMATT